MKVIILAILSFLMIGYMILYYLDFKNGRLKINKRTVLGSPIFILVLFILLSFIIHFAEAIYYNCKYDPTDLIFNRNIERTNLHLCPMTKTIISDKIFPRTWKRYLEDDKFYSNNNFVNIDSVKSKLYYKYISIENGKLTYESDHYKFADGHIILSYNYLTEKYDYRYYTNNGQIDKAILKEECMDTFLKWSINYR